MCREFRIEREGLLFTPEQLLAAIKHPPSPNWHRRARKRRSQKQQKAGRAPWRRDIAFWASHHSRPYQNLPCMGKQGKGWHAQTPWRDDKGGQSSGSQANWSLWQGSWRSRGNKDYEQKEKTTRQQFPAYNQIKLQDGAGASRSAELMLEASETEDAPGQDFVKLLQKLLNNARRVDTKMRKLEADHQGDSGERQRDGRTRQAEEGHPPAVADGRCQWRPEPCESAGSLLASEALYGGGRRRHHPQGPADG